MQLSLGTFIVCLPLSLALACTSSTPAAPFSGSSSTGGADTGTAVTTGDDASNSDESGSSSSSSGTLTSGETTSRGDSSESGASDSTSTGSTGTIDQCELEEFDEPNPADWDISSMGAAVAPVFDGSAAVLDGTPDGGDVAIGMIRGTASRDLTNARVSTVLLEVPLSPDSLVSSFGLAPAFPSPILELRVTDGEVRVVESSFDGTTLLGTIPLSDAQLPLRLEFSMSDGTLEARASGPGGEYLLYQGATPEGLNSAQMLLAVTNLSNVSPNGLTRFDFIEICEL